MTCISSTPPSVTPHVGTMRWSLRLTVLLLVTVALSAGCRAALAPAPARAPSPIPAAQNALVRVTVTSQGYLFHRPWQQRRAMTQSAIGVVVEGDRVLVNAALVADQRYIELETIDSQKKARAKVDVVDYEANLALIAPLEPSFLSRHTAMTLSDEVSPGDTLTVVQVKPNGDIVPGNGEVTSIELGLYSQGHLFLTYRLDNALQFRFNNLTLPVVKTNRLAGLMLRQNPNDRTVDVIALPVIRHFLKDAAQGDYQGFPTAGFLYGTMQDPQLRRYIGLHENMTGIYVQKVLKGSPAHAAGLRAGDVITRMGSVAVSNTGQYQHPQYGQTSLAHLIRTQYYVGDTLPIELFRDGRDMSLSVVLDHRGPQRYLVPPYIFDRKPDYLIVGGLVLVELSIPYLQEYGSEWVTSAPVDLLYYNQNQDYLNGDHREKIVLVSDVIPTPYSIGYENFSDLELLKVNDKPIGKLSDVKAALAYPINGFHKLDVRQHPKTIYLDARQLPQIHDTIQQRYRIPIPPLE